MSIDHHIKQSSRDRDLPPRASAAGHGRLADPEVAALVKSAAAGEAPAWERLVDEFGGLVWAVARSHRLSHHDAADVAQATWLKLLEHLGRLQDPARVGAWLATTARRECLRTLRAAERSVPRGDDLPEIVSLDHAADWRLSCAERDAALWRAFKRLRASDQALLRLLIADPKPGYGEIAFALDMRVGGVGPTRARALERLRAELARDGALEALAV